MIALKLDAFKAGFFDRKAIQSKVDAASRRVFSKFGAFVRQRARTSIRRKKGKSAPAGSPPYSHTGLLRKFIFFAWDASRESVVIGPALLSGRPSAPTIPEVLEHGGSERAPRGGTTRYAARPFMVPAFEAEKPRLPQMWKDSVR